MQYAVVMYRRVMRHCESVLTGFIILLAGVQHENRFDCKERAPHDLQSQSVRRHVVVSLIASTILNGDKYCAKAVGMEKFIETVRAHPCLWNPQHPDYPEVHARGQAWQSVIKEINNSSIPNIKTARTEWRKLRDNHREALKRAKLGQNKLLPAQVTTWKYAKAMQFLEPHMKYRITENIEMEPPVFIRSKNSDHDVSTTNALESAKSDIQPHKRRCLDHDEESATKPRQEKEADALESFFNCILKSTRDMPPWMQTQVKKKIFAVIIDAEENLSSQSQNAEADRYGSHFIIENKIKTEYFEDT